MHTQSPLKWIGGKHAAAERIVAAFPKHSSYDTYVEPCGGAAHVFLCKPPYNHDEVYNDLDNNLVTFWREMQSDANALQQRLDAHPYSRAIYYEYYRSLFDGTVLSQSERAMRWFYVLRATGTGWLRKSPVGWDNRGSNAQAFHNALTAFPAIQARLHTGRVLIDNRDVLATITRYDSPRTFFYVDPPYFGAEHYYEVSKKGFPHQELAQRLQTVKGQVALSYYPHPQIEEWYPASIWRRITWQQHKSSQIQIPERGDVATELLLCNYPEPAQSLWNNESIA